MLDQDDSDEKDSDKDGSGGGDFGGVHGSVKTGSDGEAPRLESVRTLRSTKSSMPHATLDGSKSISSLDPLMTHIRTPNLVVNSRSLSWDSPSFPFSMFAVAGLWTAAPVVGG